MKSNRTQIFFAAFSTLLALAACSGGGGGGQAKNDSSLADVKPVVESGDSSVRIEKYAKLVGQPVEKVTATFKEVTFKDKDGVEKKVDLTARLAQGGQCCNDREGLQAFITASYALDSTFRDGIEALNALNSRLGHGGGELATRKAATELKDIKTIEDGSSNTIQIEEKKPVAEKDPKDSIERFMETYRPISALTTLLRGRLVAGADALGFLLSPKFMTDLRDQAAFKETVDKFSAFLVEGAKSAGVELDAETLKELAVPIASVSFEADGKFYSFYRFDARGDADAALAAAKDAPQTRERIEGSLNRSRGAFEFIEAIENVFVDKSAEELRPAVLERNIIESPPEEKKVDGFKAVEYQASPLLMEQKNYQQENRVESNSAPLNNQNHFIQTDKIKRQYQAAPFKDYPRITCGNGIQEPDEQCDDGTSNGQPPSNCDGNCHLVTQDSSP
ncbi:MAG: hypothetical protein K8R69_05425 [Deltaproteobacteria bacterium]|nr:hypothetical protein [Deltaproteobacteria bacterium]